MTQKKFHPTELLFSPLSHCNLSCKHCGVLQHGDILPIRQALRFLRACSDYGIKRVGFTGGEPFLALDFVLALTREAVKRDMIFGRISTNGVWFNNERDLNLSLSSLCEAGYDGVIAVSVDAFHDQDLKKVGIFLKTAVDIFNRPDIICIASVKGLYDNITFDKLKQLARLLDARFIGAMGKPSVIKSKDYFIEVGYNPFSLAGVTHLLKNPWGQRWFKDDFCKGPGNIFFVAASGSVAPCCGYANENDILSLGTIKDSPSHLVANAHKNKFINDIFTTGFHPMRRNLERHGVTFPGETMDHCFFCDYLAKMRYVNKDSLVTR